jgi:hypothetical protein
MVGERFYGGGNTKATRRWNQNDRWGYRVHERELWVLVVNLMNDGTEDIDAVVRVDFEWVSASSAEGRRYREVRPIWLALADFCGDSGVPVPSLTKSFSQKNTDMGLDGRRALGGRSGAYARWWVGHGDLSKRRGDLSFRAVIQPNPRISYHRPMSMQRRRASQEGRCHDDGSAL